MNEQAVGKELLDATQEAVIGVADNVENILKNTSQELHRADDAFYLSAEFWVGMAFVLVVVALFIPLKKGVRAFLEQYVKRETGRISEAEQLKNEARKLLASYEQKLETVEDEAAAVVDQATQNAAAIKKRTMAELKQQSRILEKSACERIKDEQSRAENELSKLIAERTIGLLEERIATHMTAEIGARLIDESIERISLLPSVKD